MDEDYYSDYGDDYSDGNYDEEPNSSTEDTTSNSEDSTNNTPGECITISHFCFDFDVFNYYFMLKRVKIIQALQKAQQVVFKI